MTRRRIRRSVQLRGTTARDAVDEVDDEVRLHVELRAAELMRQGLDEASARARAEALFARDPDTLCSLYESGRIEREGVAPNTSSWIPYGVFRALREDMTTFTAVGAYRVEDRHIGSDADARRLRMGQVLGAFFPLLGVQPHAGRLFANGDDAAIVGVAPPGFVGTEARNAQIFAAHR